jgi:CRISPR-associated protein Cmr6
MRNEIIKLASRRNMGHHPGLLLQRYIVPPQDDSDKAKQTERRDLLNAVRQAADIDVLYTLYADAFNRWEASFPKDSLHSAESLKTEGRLIVGLGSENVLEAGLRLHHTYGVPIVPASALKGLASHYCHDVWGQRYSTNISTDNKAYQRGGDFHERVFGMTEDRGLVVFQDAWITPASLKLGALRLDVMTPHHPRWQLGPGNREFASPTDFDSPVPVSFLSVTGTFLIQASWNGPMDTPVEVATDWVNRTMMILKEALAEWGVGGKTSSGYGRLVMPPPTPLPPPPKKRSSNDKARVKVVARRPKGGFDVQDIEPGRASGTLTVGIPPVEADTNLGAILDVLVHIDEQKRPQYKWPQSAKK